MVVKDNNNDNKDEKKESIGKKIGLWIARIIVMILFLYLAAVLFNYLPLLPIYGATYLPLDKTLFKSFYKTSDQDVLVHALKNQSGGAGDDTFLGGNITDLIDLYKNVWKELCKKNGMKFNLLGKEPDKTVEKLTNGQDNNKKNKIISDIIKNMLRNPATMKTIRDTMSKKSKHFFASIPITAALLKIAEFSGVADIDRDGAVVKGSNFGLSEDRKFTNNEKKSMSVALLEVEQKGGIFSEKTVYDVNKFCTKNMIFWYLKQFFVLIATTISAIFMWPIYYLHEVEIVQGAPLSETGKVEPCSENSGGKALQIIILILGLLFMVYNAYARCYSLTESLVTIFKSGKIGKTWSNIILWISISGGIGVGIIGFALYKYFENGKAEAIGELKNGNKAGSRFPSMLSQPLLRGLIDHYGLLKSALICLVGAVILGSIWSMSLTGSWPMLAIFAFFFPIAGLILIYLTQSEMATIFIEKGTLSTNNFNKETETKTNTSITKNYKALSFEKKLKQN